MKLRNQLLALACMAVFFGLGYLYVSFWVVQKPYGIILFVSDGMVARQLTMARLFEGGADHQLGMEAFPHLALLRNAANDFAVPDDAAAATALATGVRGNHRILAMDAEGRDLVTITSLARKEGRAVGIVTNGSLTDPTPAAFYGHARDARETGSLALQLVEKFRPEIAMGGGALDFLPTQSGGRRKDGRELLSELQKGGCEIVRTKVELENVASYGEGGVLGLFAPESLGFTNDLENANQQPSLADMVRCAVTLLQQSRKGYLLIVDAALVGTAAGRNEGEHTISETIALDRAISTATRYAGEKSLVLAVGKHSTGGMNLNGYPLHYDHGVALLGSSPEGYPYLTWSSGPNGPGAAAPSPGARTEPAACLYPSALNTAEDVVALGQGLGAQKLHGIMESTVVFQILRDAL